MYDAQMFNFAPPLFKTFNAVAERATNTDWSMDGEYGPLTAPYQLKTPQPREIREAIWNDNNPAQRQHEFFDQRDELQFPSSSALAHARASMPKHSFPVEGEKFVVKQQQAEYNVSTYEAAHGHHPPPCEREVDDPAYHKAMTTFTDKVIKPAFKPYYDMNREKMPVLSERALSAKTYLDTDDWRQYAQAKFPEETIVEMRSQHYGLRFYQLKPSNRYMINRGIDGYITKRTVFAKIDAPMDELDINTWPMYPMRYAQEKVANLRSPYELAVIHALKLCYHHAMSHSREDAGRSCTIFSDAHNIQQPIMPTVYYTQRALKRPHEPEPPAQLPPLIPRISQTPQAANIGLMHAVRDSARRAAQRVSVTIAARRRRRPTTTSTSDSNAQPTPQRTVTTLDTTSPDRHERHRPSSSRSVSQSHRPATRQHSRRVQSSPRERARTPRHRDTRRDTPKPRSTRTAQREYVPRQFCARCHEYGHRPMACPNR